MNHRDNQLISQLFNNVIIRKRLFYYVHVINSWNEALRMHRLNYRGNDSYNKLQSIDRCNSIEDVQYFVDQDEFVLFKWKEIKDSVINLCRFGYLDRLKLVLEQQQSSDESTLDQYKWYEDDQDLEEVAEKKKKPFSSFLDRMIADACFGGKLHIIQYLYETYKHLGGEVLDQIERSSIAYSRLDIFKYAIELGLETGGSSIGTTTDKDTRVERTKNIMMSQVYVKMGDTRFTDSVIRYLVEIDLQKNNGEIGSGDGHYLLDYDIISKNFGVLGAGVIQFLFENGFKKFVKGSNGLKDMSQTNNIGLYRYLKSINYAPLGRYVQVEMMVDAMGSCPIDIIQEAPPYKDKNYRNDNELNHFASRGHYELVRYVFLELKCKRTYAKVFDNGGVGKYPDIFFFLLEQYRLDTDPNKESITFTKALLDAIKFGQLEIIQTIEKEDPVCFKEIALVGENISKCILNRNYKPNQRSINNNISTYNQTFFYLIEKRDKLNNNQDEDNNKTNDKQLLDILLKKAVRRDNIHLVEWVLERSKTLEIQLEKIPLEKAKLTSLEMIELIYNTFYLDQTIEPFRLYTTDLERLQKLLVIMKVEPIDYYTKWVTLQAHLQNQIEACSYDMVEFIFNLIQQHNQTWNPNPEGFDFQKTSYFHSDFLKLVILLCNLGYQKYFKEYLFEDFAGHKYSGLRQTHHYIESFIYLYKLQMNGEIEDKKFNVTEIYQIAKKQKNNGIARFLYFNSNEKVLAPNDPIPFK
ncbi:hypothetical protein DFA_07377 [Cavenderia fasciculata]|uniref:Uncharacterized protein n=1 Tax=Cavenderia fasciculata TaxID=261658 RepID=F4PW90_CACFS|nr:uncharacterized protein DFA_07377 [Cavenderia fasciculata]EGG20254.1 hypothetical protein DFA_07377 [Cavenderia fasciculata]|eukprot:XP_004367237.1 hypothetical protein DFA_07377 [Cavenderia fasciculata]